jgi:thiamine-monophosphate kinase
MIRATTHVPRVQSGEKELIDRLRRHIPSTPGGILRLGIGDDAAVNRPARGQEWVITSDQFVEGVHFLSAMQPPESIGYKALARAASDVGAMGAQPMLFLLSISLPPERSGAWLDKMARGMGHAARQHRLTLAGGDTAATAKGNATVAMDLMVLGKVPRGRAVSRRGARPGDAVFVTGTLGKSQLGLELILRGAAHTSRWSKLLRPHFYPEVGIALGQWLAKQRLVSAMMDVSDGLSTDLHRLCTASHVGARIYENKLPCVEVPAPLRSMGIDSKTLALHGGEDYGLLFTVRKQNVRGIPNAFRGQRITRIGDIVSGSKVTLVSGDATSLLKPHGWDHFRKVS